MSEAAFHRAVAGYLRVALRSPTIWSTIPSGGGGRVRGAQLKAAGLQPGLPDILVLHPMADGTRVVGIELKTERGRPSLHQRVMLRAFGEAGARYTVCRSLDEVAEVLEFARIPLHARHPAGSILADPDAVALRMAADRRKREMST